MTGAARAPTSRSLNFKHWRRTSLTIAVAMLAVAGALLLYGGGIDDYAPKHSGTGAALLAGRNYDAVAFQEVPGFYVLIGTVQAMTGIPPGALANVAILAVPSAIVLFFFFATTSKRSGPWLPLAAMLVLLTLNSTPTHRLLLWAHGFGEIVFLCLCGRLLSGVGRNRSAREVILYTILVAGLMFVSYSYGFLALVFVGALLLLSAGTKSVPAGSLAVAGAGGAIVWLLWNISNSGSLVDTVGRQFSLLRASAVDVFFDYFLSSGSESQAGLSPFLVHYPQSVSFLVLMRPAVYATAIVCAFFLFSSFDRRRRQVFLALLGAAASILAVRLLIGDLAVGYIVFPALLALVAARKGLLRQAAPWVLAALLVINFSAILLLRSQGPVHDEGWQRPVAAAVWETQEIPSFTLHADQLGYAYAKTVYETSDIPAERQPLYLGRLVEPLYLFEPMPPGYYISLNVGAGYIQAGGYTLLIPYHALGKQIEDHPSFGRLAYDNGAIRVVETT